MPRFLLFDCFGDRIANHNRDGQGTSRYSVRKATLVVKVSSLLKALGPLTEESTLPSHSHRSSPTSNNTSPVLLREASAATNNAINNTSATTPEPEIEDGSPKPTDTAVSGTQESAQGQEAQELSLQHLQGEEEEEEEEEELLVLEPNKSQTRTQQALFLLQYQGRRSLDWAISLLLPHFAKSKRQSKTHGLTQKNLAKKVNKENISLSSHVGHSLRRSSAVQALPLWVLRKLLGRSVRKKENEIRKEEREERAKLLAGRD
ncbi:hypothetical protein MKZ38_008979 [Zalerion maritima]|uniref:Uncharacterized protein n=1 Tax=Zalerion maritima TaxID=339359 RepID=A0AAD5RTS9_9PEZI|nr:hypothetical protein MKZ38_008979 [Zalerion maritima]